MKTSSNNTYLIERYLDGKMCPIDRLLFETKTLVSLELRKDIYFQQKTHQLVKMYHRKKVKEDLESLHQQIFNNPSRQTFKERIFKIFGE